MLFTILESFSPADGAVWTDYCSWRGMTFERFDSIDGILRPRLFHHPEAEDWAHIVDADFMLHLITDYSYAQRKLAQLGKGDLVGLRFEEHQVEDGGFLGFDLIDGYCDISLLTNWGNGCEIINRSLASNGLVPDLKRVEEIQSELRSTHGQDPHVQGCRIISVYKPRGNISGETSGRL